MMFPIVPMSQCANTKNTNIKKHKFTNTAFDKVTGWATCGVFLDVQAHSLTHWATFDFGTYDKPLVVRELPRRLVIFKSFDQSDEKTWPDKFLPKNVL